MLVLLLITITLLLNFDVSINFTKNKKSFFLGLILGHYGIRDRNSTFLVNNKYCLSLLPVIFGQTITITGDIGTDYYYYYYR